MKIYTSEEYQDARKRGYRFGFICLVVGFSIAWAIKTPQTIVKTVEVEKIVEVAPSPTPTPTPAPEEKLTYIVGEASYYSVDGCIGCDPDRIMANGEQLNDEARTLAMTPEMVSKYHLLNKTVTVENLTTHLWVRARVTDTGGFGSLGRVADLSLATKKVIDCPSICNVKITFD